MFPTLLSAQTAGNLTEEHWNNVSGSSLLEMKEAVATRVADTTLLRAAAEAPQDTGTNYGRRMRGTVTAPISGDYTFFIAGDDEVELWVSEDASGLNKKLVAYHKGHTSYLQWDKSTTQHSEPLSLVAGQEYFIEALQKEGGGADHLSIGWNYEIPTVKVQSSIGGDFDQTWSEEDGVISLSVDGGDVWGTNDMFIFNHRQLAGNGEVVARITEMNNPYHWSKVGLMFRSTLEGNSAHGFVMRTGSLGMAFQRRLETGQSSKGSYYGNGNFEWIKLKRKADVIEAFVSHNGESWTRIGSDTFVGLPDTLYVGVAATNNSAVSTSPVVATVEDFQVTPLEATEVIPSEHLTSFVADPSDADLNGLDDSWEAQFPITGTAFEQSEYGDPDGDLVSNIEESILGTDPTAPSSKPEHWLRENWYDTTGYDVLDLLEQDDFYGSPSATLLVKGAEATNGTHDGTRMRAYLTAPESGEYRFWVSSRGGAELWISTDDSKARKQRVAVMGSSAGTGHGVLHNSSSQWDTFATQMSEPVYLEAGQRYFIEHLSQNGHVPGHNGIAWARPGQEREYLDTQFISSYAKELSDLDDDSLPDAWETQHGLSATDNGLVNREQEGENGDFDYDGLSNRLEYVYGSDPTNPDSDGDGINDGQEIFSYGSDPAVSDAPAETLLSSVDLSTFTNADAQWTETSSGLISASFRGGLEWSFTVPTDGHWSIHLATKLLGDLYLNEVVPATVSIDGNDIWSGNIVYGQQREALVRVLTPLLSAGQHTVRLNIDNMIARRSVSIQSLDIYTPTGTDNNSNGTPDWIESQLQGINKVFAYQSMSRTSPAFLEGSTRVFADTLLNGNSVLTSTGSNGWYANLALNENALTDFIVGFESNVVQGGGITWSDTNVLDNETLVIRKGDSLKLTVAPSAITELSSSSITFTQHPSLATVGVITYTLNNDSAHVAHQFQEAGDYTIVGTHSNGQTGTLNLTVKQADFSTVAHDMVNNSVGSISVPVSTVDSDLTFDLGDSGRVNTQTVSGDFLNLQVSSQSLGSVKIAARLYAGGPILNTKELNFIGISDAIQNDLTTSFVSQNFQGYYKLTSPLVATNLPVGGKVKVTIYRAGVTFLDGTKVMWVEADDLVNGVINLEFLFPIGMSGGYCHTLDVYDRNGAFIDRRQARKTHFKC